MTLLGSSKHLITRSNRHKLGWNRDIWVTKQGRIIGNYSSWLKRAFRTCFQLPKLLLATSKPNISSSHENKRKIGYINKKWIYNLKDQFLLKSFISLWMRPTTTAWVRWSLTRLRCIFRLTPMSHNFKLPCTSVLCAWLSPDAANKKYLIQYWFQPSVWLD